MAEVIRRDPIVPGDRKEVVGGGIREPKEPGDRRDVPALFAAYKRWLSWLLRLAHAKAKAEAKAPPSWVRALEAEMRSFSVTDRISDLGLLIGFIDRATTGKKPPAYFSRKLDESPYLEGLILDSVKRYVPSHNQQAGTKASESLKLSVPKQNEQAGRKATDTMIIAYGYPVRAAEFKQSLKSERLDLCHENRRLKTQKGDPDFSGMSEAYRAAVADRLRHEVLQEASRLEEGDPERRQLEVMSRIIDFDPKQGGVYFNSYWLEDLSTFDLAEESPIGPMRFTKKVFQDNKAKGCAAVNILSVKVACSDVGFPIKVYGTVIARDSTDYKRIYLFHRDRDHCQLIYSEDEPLILTGPKRGLAMLDGNYVEIDLKIRYQGQDSELSKGFFVIEGIVARSLEKCMVDTLYLGTRLSYVKMVYAVVVSAVEATIAIEVVEGKFRGTVTAHTTSIKETLLLYDSREADHKHAGLGPLKMMRPVICVSVKDEMIITAKALGGKCVVFTITPKFSRGHRGEFTLGTAKMRLQVDWSIMDP